MPLQLGRIFSLAKQFPLTSWMILQIMSSVALRNSNALSYTGSAGGCYSQMATIDCGNHTSTFTALAITADILNKIHEQLGFNLTRQVAAKSSEPPINVRVLRMSSYLRAYSAAGFRKDIGNKPNFTFKNLMDTIIHTRSCKAADLQDKVFSTLGLMDPEFWDWRPTCWVPHVTLSTYLLTRAKISNHPTIYIPSFRYSSLLSLEIIHAKAWHTSKQQIQVNCSTLCRLLVPQHDYWLSVKGQADSHGQVSYLQEGKFRCPWRILESQSSPRPSFLGPYSYWRIESTIFHSLASFGEANIWWWAIFCFWRKMKQHSSN